MKYNFLNVVVATHRGWWQRIAADAAGRHVDARDGGKETARIAISVVAPDSPKST